MDFSASSAIDRINHWVSDKTQAKITKILNQIDPLSVMFIINAIYFKGTWTHQFDPQKTHAGVFYQETSSSLTCDMMHQEKRMAYLETEILQAVSLPYGDSLFYMTIFLPKEGYTVNSIMSQLTQSQWNQWLSQFNSDSVNLTMPKFKMEYEIKLNDVLQSMGMIAAFNPDQANFSGISDQDIYISEVRHKSMVDVNEEGTVAAAVTIIDFRLTSVGTVKYMTINRPFVFMIHNKQTGTILFMGKISKPEYQ